MKKMLLSLSALSIGIAPAAGLLNTSKKQVITVATEQILKQMEQTSLAFKPSILANAHQMNADVAKNVIDAKQVSEVSEISSELTVKDFNKKVYNQEQSDPFFKKLNNSSGFKYADTNAKTEFVFNTLDQGTNLLEKTITDDGLVPYATNEFLNWVSYVSILSGNALGSNKIDQTLTSLSGKLNFLNFGIPTPPSYDDLKNVYGVDTIGDLQNFIIVEIANLLAEKFAFNGSLIYKETGFISKTKWNNLVPPRIDYEGLKVLVSENGTQGSERFPRQKPKEGLNTDKYSTEDKRSVEEHIIDFVSEIIKFKLNQPKTNSISSLAQNKPNTYSDQLEPSTNYLGNILYSISWYISAYDKYKTETIIDDNHLFSENKTNMEIFAERKKDSLTPEDVSDKGLKGLTSILKNLLVKEDDKTSLKGLKILFQVDDDVTNISYKKKWGLGIFPPGLSGQWTKKVNYNNGLNLLINGVFVGLIGSDVVKSKIPSGLGWLINDGVGSAIGNLISSILANNDNTQFFTELSKDGILNTLVGAFVPELPTYLNYIGKVAVPENEEEGFFNKTLSKLITWPLSKTGETLKPILTLVGVTMPQLPNLVIKDILNLGFGNITIGSMLWLVVSNAHKPLEELIKVKNLFNALSATSGIDKYDFYLKDKKVDVFTEVLGYPESDTQKGTDIALAWSMMKFRGFNNTVGIRAKGDDSGVILYGHRAWKQILGLEWDENDRPSGFSEKTLLFSLNQVVQSRIGSLVIKLPIKLLRKTVDKNLADISFDRNKLVSYRVNAKFFKNELVSYDSTNDHETLEYIIHYQVKLNTYVNYRVIVKKTKNTTSKFEIQNFALLS